MMWEIWEGDLFLFTTMNETVALEHYEMGYTVIDMRK